jgi:hypothetical protein
MMKKYAERVTFILLVSTGFLLQSCRYYVNKQVDKESPKALFSNHYVVHLVHFEGEMLELTNVFIDQKKKTVSGIPVKFTGLARMYYDNAAAKKTGKWEDNQESRNAISQTHFFVPGDSYDGTSSEWKIQYDEILRVEVLKDDPGKTFASVFFPVILGVGVTILIIFLGFSGGS